MDFIREEFYVGVSWFAINCILDILGYISTFTTCRNEYADMVCPNWKLECAIL